jgi:hypothetical protein
MSISELRRQWEDTGRRRRAYYTPWGMWEYVGYVLEFNFDRSLPFSYTSSDRYVNVSGGVVTKEVAGRLGN